MPGVKSAVVCFRAPISDIFSTFFLIYFIKQRAYCIVLFAVSYKHSEAQIDPAEGQATRLSHFFGTRYGLWQPPQFLPTILRAPRMAPASPVFAAATRIGVAAWCCFAADIPLAAGPAMATAIPAAKIAALKAHKKRFIDVSPNLVSVEFGPMPA